MIYIETPNKKAIYLLEQAKGIKIEEHEGRYLLKLCYPEMWGDKIIGEYESEKQVLSVMKYLQFCIAKNNGKDNSISHMPSIEEVREGISSLPKKEIKHNAEELAALDKAIQDIVEKMFRGENNV